MASAITGWGAALPARTLTNEELAGRLGVTSDWIFERTGVRSRRVVGHGETTSSMAAEAGAAALRVAGIDPIDVEIIICATSTPDLQLPATASLVQHRLGCTKAGSFDLGAACTGFLYGIAQAQALVDSGAASVVLVCGADSLTPITDYSDAKSCVLFGDGAGAVVIERSSDVALGPFVFGGDAGHADALYVHPEERLIRMQGREVYRHAVEQMSEGLGQVLARAGLTADRLDLVVAHQANGRILEAVAERVGLAPARLAVNIDQVGNTSAASVPLALVHAIDEGKVADGDTLALVAFGAGFTWGAGLVHWGANRRVHGRRSRIPALVGTTGHLLEVV